MKRLFIGFFLCLFLVQNLVAAPLVFKATKEVKAGGELTTFESGKYKNVRVGVSWLTPTELPEQSDILIQAIEDTDSIFLQTFFVHKSFSTRSVFIESPPSKIKISASQSGAYKIFIWAE